MAPTSAEHALFPGVRLHIVTGKGGTGKTTVAASLALALAGTRHRVLLVEVEGRQGIAQLFDTSPLPYAERKVASGRDGGEVYALAIDAEEALLEYLDMFYNLRRAGRALQKIGAIDFATTIAPGMRDVLLTGKIKEAVRRHEKARRGVPTNGRVYDAVVVDAPPTGRIVRFLNVTTEVAGLAKVGPIHSQAESVMGLLRSPLTAVHFVTLLEDMPVQETLDGLAELHAAQLPAGAVIVNAVHDEELPDEVLDAAEAGLDPDLLVAGLRQADLPTDTAVAKALAAEALDHARRVALQRAQRARLADAGRPVLELPFVADTSDRTIDLGALYRLADLLCEQGLGRPDKGAA